MRIAALLLALALVACGGPSARILSTEASEVSDGRTIVTVQLENRGGEGAIELAVSVRDGGGAVVGRKTESVDLAQGERIRLAVEVPVAAGVTHVDAEAKAIYPPE